MTTADRRPPTLLDCVRKGDGVEARLYLADPRHHHEGAEAFAASRHRMALGEVLSQVDPRVWEPVVHAGQAARQAMEVRAEADRVERDMHHVRAQLAHVKADLRMPGVEKLSRERQLNQRLVELNGTHQGHVRDAAELERRAGNNKAEARKLFLGVAREAVARAAKAMVAEADRRLREWAARFPVMALLVADCNGMGAVDRLADELERMMAQAADRPQTHAPAGLDLSDGPERADPDCPTCRAGMHWSHRNQRWTCVECGTVREDQYQSMLDHEAQHRAADAVPVRDHRADIGPDDPLRHQPRPAGVDPELSRRLAPAAPPVQTQFPYHENWPPPEGADPAIPGEAPSGGPLTGPHVQVAAGSDGTADDPYRIAQQAQERADAMLAQGYAEPPPASPSQTTAPPTQPFDRTNGGWNGAPTSPEATNGSPFAPGQVDSVLRSLGRGTGGGPAVELGPDEFPGV